MLTSYRKQIVLSQKKVYRKQERSIEYNKKQLHTNTPQYRKYSYPLYKDDKISPERIKYLDIKYKEYRKETVLYSLIHKSYINICNNINIYNNKLQNKKKYGILSFPIYNIDDLNNIAKEQYKIVNIYINALENEYNILHPLELLSVIDSISNRLCLIADISEFLRLCHPDNIYRKTADTVWRIMQDHFIEISMNPIILKSFNHLYKCINNNFNPTIEEKRIIEFMYIRYKNIHTIKPSTSKLICKINQECLVLQNEFLNNLQSYQSRYIYNITVDDIIDGNTYEVDSILSCIDKKDSNSINIQLCPGIVNIILSNNPKKSVRKAIYIENCIQYIKNINILFQILKKRTYICNLQGYSTYTESVLATEIAKNPNNVINLLDTINIKSLNILREFISNIFISKKSFIYKNLYKLYPSLINIQPWDIQYIIYNIQKDIYINNNIKKYIEIEYFSLDTIFNALCKICKDIFSLEFKRIEPITKPYIIKKIKNYDDITQWELRDSNTNYLYGTVYLDLFSRDNKTTNAATFTIFNGRSIPMWDLLYDINNTKYNTINSIIDNDSRQLPIVSLCMNCNYTIYDNTILCCHQDLVTLLHEFGHTLQIILSNTKYQQLSGVRGELDFAEIPSTLLENLAFDIRFLQSICVHYNTKEPISYTLASTIINVSIFERIIHFAEIVKASAIDQQIYQYPLISNLNYDNNNDIIELDKFYNFLQDIILKYSIYNEKKSLDIPHYGIIGSLTHLINYSGSYYTYIYSEIFSRAIYYKLFKYSIWDPNIGIILKKYIYTTGGSQYPLVNLSLILNSTLDKDGSIIIDDTMYNTVDINQEQQDRLFDTSVDLFNQWLHDTITTLELEFISK